MESIPTKVKHSHPGNRAAKVPASYIRRVTVFMQMLY